MQQTLRAWWTETIASKPSARLTASFLTLSCAISIAFLSVRNIYDDEYANLLYVNLPISKVIHVANATDVHPPGMYLLTWCAYHLIPSPRWMNVFPLMFLYTGLAIFCFALAPYFRTKASLLCFLLLATLHPQLIMWGNTIRWYSWWTGIALATIIIALKARGQGEKPFSYARSIVLALLLTALFYLNYIAFIFFAVLMLAMIFRYPGDIWKQLVRTTFLFAVGIFPQLHAFFAVHIPNGSTQRAGILLSFARLTQATLCSEAYLPWHPLAIAALLLFGSLIMIGVLWCIKKAPNPLRTPSGTSKTRTLTSIVVFVLLFFAFLAISGLGIKPRNGLLLAPLMAVPIALVIGALRSWHLQLGALIILTAWSVVGAEHLLLRKGLAKSNMINRPEEVTAYIRNAQEGNCNVVVTYDSLLTLTVTTAGLPRTTLLTSEIFPLPIHRDHFQPAQCHAVNLYLVRSSLNDIQAAPQIAYEMNTVSASLSNPKTLYFSHDPDAAIKRRIGSRLGGDDIPDYRYIVTAAQLSPATLTIIEKQLLHFAPADGSPKPD